eukprot:Skav211658  [mRNA]  locus=scaffold2752:82735:93789:- [translate_table: standard]
MFKCCFLPSHRGYVKFKMPVEDAVKSDEVVLLKPLVQPGVASRAFSLLSCGDLCEMARASVETNQWRETGLSLCAVLRCPSVLNASFHFQGMPGPHLDCQALHSTLELIGDVAPLELHHAVLDAAEAGLKDFLEVRFIASKGPHTAEQLRGVLIYLMLPQLRNTKFVQSRRHAILSQLALLVALLPVAERRRLVPPFNPMNLCDL